MTDLFVRTFLTLTKKLLLAFRGIKKISDRSAVIFKIKKMFYTELGFFFRNGHH